MRTSRETMKTTAKMIVMRSRFFSMILVPVCVEYNDHIGNTRALARVKQNEHDESDARQGPDDENSDEQRIHVTSPYRLYEINIQAMNYRRSSRFFARKSRKNRRASR